MSKILKLLDFIESEEFMSTVTDPSIVESIKRLSREARIEIVISSPLPEDFVKIG